MKTVRVLAERTEMLNGVPNLILQVEMAGRDRGLNVYIPLAAIENRKQVYGLETDEEAIEAILKEHATRELDMAQHAHENLKIGRMGGLRRDVAVERTQRGPYAL